MNCTVCPGHRERENCAKRKGRIADFLKGDCSFLIATQRETESVSTASTVMPNPRYANDCIGVSKASAQELVTHGEALRCPRGRRARPALLSVIGALHLCRDSQCLDMS